MSCRYKLPMPLKKAVPCALSAGDSFFDMEAGPIFRISLYPGNYASLRAVWTLTPFRLRAMTENTAMAASAGMSQPSPSL